MPDKSVPDPMSNLCRLTEQALGSRRRLRRASETGGRVGIGLHAADGIAEVVIDFPPVNALPVSGWFELADALGAAAADPEVRVVILAAEGRGFCAGVDI